MVDNLEQFAFEPEVIKMKFVDFMADSRDFYTGLIDPVCKKYGLTQMEFNILLFLANNPECDTAAQIIRKRAFTKSHVSMSVRSLEERGLLTGEYMGRTGGRSI